MKQFKFFLLLLLMTFCLASQHPGKGNGRIKTGNGLLLVYAGNISTKYLNLDVGIHFEMDSSVGIRYEVAYEKGNIPVSHIAIFYKFSSPDQTVLYNFLTHQSTIDTHAPSPDNDADVSVLGTEAIDSFTCTHLQKKGSSDLSESGATDFWMSKQVAGFPQVVNVLKKIDPNMVMGLTQVAFKWGGLVKIKMTAVNKKTGETSNAIVQLQEANPTMSFPASDFNVPGN
ncbi:MAG: DUF4412 domain-containing protein [Ginsengibacter sp.]